MDFLQSKRDFHKKALKNLKPVKFGLKKPQIITKKHIKIAIIGFLFLCLLNFHYLFLTYIFNPFL